MYEDKRTRLKINWKSLIIKMAILLVVVFLFMWIVSLINRPSKKLASNIGENLKTMQAAAGEYFTGSRLPERINGKETLTLNDMINSKLIVEFKDQNGKTCEKDESYAEATKISDDEYTIKVKLVCGKENDYVINTIKVENQLVDNVPQPDVDTDIDSDTNVDDSDNYEDDTTNSDTNNDNNNVNSNVNNNTNNSNSSSGSSSNKPTPSKKPTITYVTTDKNNNSSSQNSSSSNTTNNSTNNNTNTNTNNNNSNSNSNTNNNTSSNNSTNNNSSSNNNTNNTPDNNSNSNTCIYGSKDYSAVYPAAYLIGGNCAVSKDDYLKEEYANAVKSIAEAEYQKLSSEMASLGKSTASSLVVSYPTFNPIFNKANTGLVGYQVMFQVKVKQTYTTKTIYQYYLDTNGNRKIIIDNRASLK